VVSIVGMVGMYGGQIILLRIQPQYISTLPALICTLSAEKLRSYRTTADGLSRLPTCRAEPTILVIEMANPLLSQIRCSVCPHRAQQPIQKTTDL